MCGRTALWRRPSASVASLVNMAHLVFRWAAEAVSAKESDRSVAIAHPDAAVSAAVGVLRCRGLGPPQAGSTRGGIAHLVVVKRLHKVSLTFYERQAPVRLPSTSWRFIVIDLTALAYFFERETDAAI